MSSITWRNASTLILVARKSASLLFGKHSMDDSFNYCCMLLKRSGKSKAFAKAYVFPGGVIDRADNSNSWLDHFINQGFNEQQLRSQFSTPQLSDVPVYKDLALLQPQSIPELNCRISAIRETFEETGVLLCQSNNPSQQNSSILPTGSLTEWQEQVHEDPPSFLRLCQQFNIYPNVWSLHEWSNWLTPEHLGSKRFDTVFFLSICDFVPNVNIDNKEITEVQWLDPVTALKLHYDGSIHLAPPQIYELSRLANFKNLDDLKEFVIHRSSKGLQRWLPTGLKTEDGIITILPGDSLYPAIKDGSDRDIQKTTSHDLKCSGPWKNRMSFSKSVYGEIMCNISDPHGHLRPLNVLGDFQENKPFYPKL